MAEEDLELFSRQLSRETHQSIEATTRLRNRTKRAESKSYASSTIYGQSLLKNYVGIISKSLDSRLQYLRKGGGAVDAATVYQHLKNADMQVVTVITMKVCLDVLGKDIKPQLADLTIAIGKAIETELRLNYYFAQDKDLYKHITHSFHSATGTRQKATVYRLHFNRENIVWPTWSRETTHKIGSWSLDCLCRATNWITKETIPVGKRKSRTVMRYSQEFLGLKDSIIHRAENLAFCRWPMVCKPIEWTNDQKGGYLTEEIRNGNSLVRYKGPLQGGKQGELPIQFLNNLQNQEYCINLFVYNVARHCFDTFKSIGKFKRAEAKQPPAKLEGEPTKEELKAHKKQRRQIEDYNAQIEQKNYRTTEVMYVAEKYKDEKRFYVPWSFGYRGRVYPLVDTLSPQGTDFDKALLYFYQEGPIDEYWLAFQVATTYGLDKETYNHRYEWVKQNIPLITQVATDPIGNMSLWEDTEEPWCFIASCFEYWSCCIAKTKTTSGLPCGIDATQSGIQHLSALTLDATAAELVNVLPTDKPADGYRTVAEHSIKYLQDKTLAQYIDRKVTKRTTMTLCYGVTAHSARAYIREALMEKGVDLSIPGRLTDITKAIYECAIPEVFPGPVDVMKWFQQCARKIMETQDSIQWTTPSGFIVRQDLRKSLSKRVQTRLMGAVIDCKIGNGWGGPDNKHHVSALSPNVVHSYDASLLHFTFAEWDKPFTVIHDCVLGRSCDMEQMSKDIRMHFVEMYKEPILEDWAKQVGVDVPLSLIKGTLDINKVNNALYFFC